MTDVLTADDPRYAELFDIANEARLAGNTVDGDLNPDMNRLRDTAPVLKGALRDLVGLPPGPHARYTQEREGYTFLSFKACDRGFREVENFSSHVYREVPGMVALGKTILQMDAPEHLSYRATVQPMFVRPRTATWWRQNWIQEIVDALLDQLEANPSAELNLQFCARLPMHTVARGIGIEAEKALEFRDHLLRAISDSRSTPQQKKESMQWIDATLLSAVVERRTSPGDDVITGLINAELALPDETPRKLTDDEIAGFCRLIVLAGGGTTWRQLGIAIWALLTHRDQWEACKADRSLIDAAIEETLRWNATDPVFSRLAVRDIEVEGVLVPAGARVDVCLGAANRDPARWERPDEFDIFRPKKVHLGFAIGEHQCLGLNVAREEMLCALNGLMDRFPDMRLDPDAPPPELIGGLEQRGMSAIPVLLR